MNIKGSFRDSCKCCDEEYINIPLDDDDLFEGDGGKPDLYLTLDEAHELIFKLQKLVNA